jgi:SSU ribosomal protein S4P
MTTGKNTKAYETPNHPYQGARIAEESDMLGRYGLKNKEELWRNESELREMRREARRLLGEAQGDVDLAGQKGAEFVARLRKLGLLSETDDISAVLSLDVTDLLERRLQTSRIVRDWPPHPIRRVSSSLTATSQSRALALRDPRRK